MKKNIINQNFPKLSSLTEVFTFKHVENGAEKVVQVEAKNSEKFQELLQNDKVLFENPISTDDDIRNTKNKCLMM